MEKSGKTREKEKKTSEKEETTSEEPFENLPVLHDIPEADTDLRKWNVDIVSDTWKNDEDRTTEDASPHRPDAKTLQNEKGNEN